MTLTKTERSALEKGEEKPPHTWPPKQGDAASAVLQDSAATFLATKAEASTTKAEAGAAEAATTTFGKMNSQPDELADDNGDNKPLPSSDALLKAKDGLGLRGGDDSAAADKGDHAHFASAGSLRKANSDRLCGEVFAQGDVGATDRSEEGPAAASVAAERLADGLVPILADIAFALKLTTETPAAAPLPHAAPSP